MVSQLDLNPLYQSRITSDACDKQYAAMTCQLCNLAVLSLGETWTINILFDKNTPVQPKYTVCTQPRWAFFQVNKIAGSFSEIATLTSWHINYLEWLI